MVGQPGVVGVHRAVAVEHAVDAAGQLGVEQAEQVVAAVQRVAAAEGLLLAELGEAEEPLRPADGADAAAAGDHGHPLDERRDDAGTQRPRDPAVASAEQVGEVLAVAAEQLVGAHPGEQHLDPGGTSGVAHEQRVDRRRVTDRLVEDVDHPRQQVHDVGRDLDLVQRDAEVRGHLPRVVRVVGHRLEPLVLAPEGDRVGLEGRVLVRRQRGDDARVQPATEEGGHGHVGDEVLGHRTGDDAP